MDPEGSDRRCVVCDAPLSGHKSREDVIPQWLQRLRNLSDVTSRPRVVGPIAWPHPVYPHGPDIVIKAERQHPTSALLAGGFCQVCNNEWMSQLESNAKPILTALVSEGTRTSLDVPQARTIAKWMIKVAFAYEQIGLGARHLVPQDHIQTVSQGGVPVGVALFLSPADEPIPRFMTYLGADWIVSPAPGREQKAIEFSQSSTYKFMFHTGNAVIVLAHVAPGDSWRLATIPELHIPALTEQISLTNLPWRAEYPKGEYLGCSSVFALGLSYGKWKAGLEVAESRGATVFSYWHEIQFGEMIDKHLSAAHGGKTGGPKSGKNVRRA